MLLVSANVPGRTAWPCLHRGAISKRLQMSFRYLPTGKQHKRILRYIQPLMCSSLHLCRRFRCTGMLSATPAMSRPTQGMPRSSFVHLSFTSCLKTFLWSGKGHGVASGISVASKTGHTRPQGALAPVALTNTGGPSSRPNYLTRAGCELHGASHSSATPQTCHL